MSKDPFPFSEFAKRTLEECQIWRDENYERNSQKMNHSLHSQDPDK
jgi:hypothetical protein